MASMTITVGSTMDQNIVVESAHDSKTTFAKLKVFAVDLPLNQQLVYSYRAYQGRLNAKPSARRIAKALGLHHRTVCDCDEWLVKLGWLADDRSVPEPSPDKLRRWRDTGNWYDDACYYTLHLPAKREALRMMAVYGVLASMGNKPASNMYLRRRLYLGHEKVKQALKTLQAAGLATYRPDPATQGFKANLKPVQDRPDLLIVKAKPTRKKTEKPAEINYADEDSAYIYKWCRDNKCGLSITDADECVKIAQRCKVPAVSADAANPNALSFKTLYMWANENNDYQRFPQFGKLLLDRMRKLTSEAEPRTQPVQPQPRQSIITHLCQKYQASEWMVKPKVDTLRDLVKQHCPQKFDAELYNFLWKANATSLDRLMSEACEFVGIDPPRFAFGNMN